MKHIVVDLEMNNVSRKDPARSICRNEVIEIGAVMLDDNLNETACFRTYVKPEHNTKIEPKITRLTGITTEMVALAPVFSDAFRMFTDWCLGTGDEITVYAWSESDYTQIRKEMQLKEYIPSDREKCITDIDWTDFQKQFDDHLGFQKRVSLESALQMAGMDFNGHAHDALDDARNTAELLHVFNDTELFNSTLRKIEELMKPSASGCALGELIDFSAWIVEENAE